MARNSKNNKLQVSLSVIFEPRDLWVGIYWVCPAPRLLKVYVCIVPCFPVLFKFYRDEVRPINTLDTPPKSGWDRKGNEFVKGCH